MLKAVQHLCKGISHSRKFAFLVFATILLSGGFEARATPVIQVQPVNKKNITLGIDVELDVTATSSTGYLEYQWQLNGVDIPNQTNAFLKIDHALPKYCGAYTVVVDDGKDAITSIPVEITLAILFTSDNDNFANRYLLAPVTNGAIRSVNKNATVETGEPKHKNKFPKHSVWFKWVAPSSGIFNLDTSGSSFDTTMDVFEGTDVTRLTPVAATDADDDGGGFLTSQFSFNAALGKEYSIRVDGFGGQTGEIVLNWSFEPTVDILPLVQFSSGIKTVGFDFSLSLFVDWLNGDSCEWFLNGAPTGNKTKAYALNRITRNDVGFYSVNVKNSKRNSQTQPAELQINVLGDGSTDSASFAFDKLNDSFLNSQQRLLVQRNSVSLLSIIPWLITPMDGGGTSSGYSTTQIFNTLASTKEPGEPNHCGVAGGASEWYNFQPAFNGTVKITTEGSNYDTVLAVYTGPGDSYATLVPLACNNNKYPLADVVRFQANSNTVYYIAIDGVAGARGTANMSIFLGTPPSISAGPQPTNVLLNGSTTLSVSATGTSPIFYQWMLNGSVVPTATNSTLTLTNFQSGNSGNYTVLVSNKIDVAVTSGAFVTLATAPQIQSITGSQTVSPGGTVNLLSTVTASPFADLQWYAGSTALVSKTSINLLLTNFSAASEGIYRLVATNIAGGVTSSPIQLSLALPLRLSSFGLSNNAFGLHSIGLANTNVVVLTSSNLVNWTPLVTNFSSSGFSDFSDPFRTSSIPRFYQFKVQP